MLDWAVLSQLQLDIVGIVAVLGEGSTSRNAQASAFGWHHVLPRLIPAPQALLRHERAKRLPTVPGTVVGAYSGKVKFELNFFCQLLHEDKLAQNEVELVEVRRKEKDSHRSKEDTEPQRPRHGRPDERGTETRRFRKQKTSKATRPAYRVKPMCPLVLLSVLGCCATLFMVVLSVIHEDGFALLATLMLSLNSSLAGFASWCRLDVNEDLPKTAAQQDRKHAIPDSDVIIYYPRQGAFRIIRCEESLSALYFKTEACEYMLGDNAYRALALVASILLMGGLLCMGNAKNSLQLAFAGTYMSLNALWWSFSAFSPFKQWGHWQHEYDSEVIKGLAPPKESPARSVKSESLSDTPVSGRIPFDLTENGANVTNNLLSMSPIRDTFTSNKSDSLGTLEVRRRRMSMNQHNKSFAEPDIELKTVEMATPAPASGQHPASILTSSKIAHSSIRSPGSDQAQARRQNTHDLEGQRARALKPFGSAWLMVRKWLDRHRLIHDLDGNETPETFTSALWKAIAVTGSTYWLHQTHIAPDNTVWRAWMEEAQKRAQTWENARGERVATCFKDANGNVMLPSWDYEGRLRALFEEERDLRKRRPPVVSRLATVVMEARLMGQISKVKRITPSIEFKLRKAAKDARLAVKRRNAQRANTTLGFHHAPNGNGIASMGSGARDLARRKSHI